MIVVSDTSRLKSSGAHRLRRSPYGIITAIALPISIGRLDLKPYVGGYVATLLLPLRVTFLRTLNSSGLLMTVYRHRGRYVP
jgi:hypothetical protein